MMQGLSTEQLLAALSRPSAYPEKPAQVEVVQTHISMVFFAGPHVYKVKKPVDFGFVDYSTLEKRLHFCQLEVELNRRLSPDVYLGVVPITRERDGLRVGGSGTPVEYAVKMRLLPRDRMLDVLLGKNAVTPAMMVALAKKIAAFHERAETNPSISAYGEPRVLRMNAEENFLQTEKYIGSTITWRQYQRIRDYSFDFLTDHRRLLWQRIAEGRIKDCHGDLHTQHVCFTDGIVVYDCIEFNERFRYGDVASEVAFLTMDLDFHGRSDLAQHFLKTYQDRSEDDDLAVLLPYYQCYRAYVRGKVESFRLDDPHTSPEEKAQAKERAQRYFHLAYSYTASAEPALFLVCGLPGTGKTTLANALARALGAEVISSDVVRKRLAGLAPTEHRYEGFDQGLYAPEMSRRTYEEMFRQARAFLQAGKPVILDATFRDKDERRRAAALAQELQRDLWVIECRLDTALLRQRMERRAAEGSISDALVQDLPRYQAAFQPIAEVPPLYHIVVSTIEPVEALLERVLRELPYRPKTPIEQPIGSTS